MLWIAIRAAIAFVAMLIFLATKEPVLMIACLALVGGLMMWGYWTDKLATFFVVVNIFFFASNSIATKGAELWNYYFMHDLLQVGVNGGFFFVLGIMVAGGTVGAVGLALGKRDEPQVA